MAAHYLTNEADLFRGGSGIDVVYGLGGDDLLYGYGGSDKLHGGIDDDRIDGGNGNDLLYGDAGDDNIWDMAGNDRVWGGLGDDTLRVGYGNDVVNGGEGNDSIIDMIDQNGGGNDRLRGGAGNDSIDSSDTGHDLIWGGNGNDILAGAGTDVIYGGNGDDLLIGANTVINLVDGIPTQGELTGGSGRDTFLAVFGNTARYDVIDIKDFKPVDDHAEIAWRASDNQVYSVFLHGSDLDPAQSGTITGDVDKVEIASNGSDLVLSFNDNDQVIVRGGADWLHVS